MTVEATVLARTVDELLSDAGTRSAAQDRTGEWDGPLWETLGTLGLTSLDAAEDLSHIAAVVRTTAAHAGRVPVAECAFVTAPWRRSLGLPSSAGPAVAVEAPGITVGRRGDGARLDGTVVGVPWARHCTTLTLAVPAEGRVLVADVPRALVQVRPGVNLAGEPRDDVALTGVDVAAECLRSCSPESLRDLRLRTAAARTLQMAGALERVLELTVQHARGRVQFGKPIGTFQAVRQLVARVAAEVVLAGCCADAVVAALVANDDFAVAAARVRVSRSATTASALAHEVHGAIGMTQEHELGRHTTRLWSWRDEADVEGWARQDLGRLVTDLGPDGLWEALTRDAPLGVA